MRTYTDDELRAFESEHHVSLPLALRELLQVSGAGAYGNVVIYRPENVRELYEEFFEDPSELFRVYLPIGERKTEQEMLICQPANATYAAIWHETVPEDWPEEEWQPLTGETLASITHGG